MRLTRERVGYPDRSRAGNFRTAPPHGGVDRPADRSDNPRVGYPDRSRAGTHRQLDTQAEERNRLRDQHGFDFPHELRIPCGDSDERPVTPSCGDVRVSTRLTGTDYAEHYDAQGAIWRPFGAPVAVSFTATDSYSHTHSRGVKPQVTVLNSASKPVVVCVNHTDDDTIQLRFDGTLTGATLLLS